MSAVVDILVPSRGALFRMALLVLVAAVAVALEAAPTGLHPYSLPSPDLLALAIAVFAVRRPDSVPILLVFALGVLRDLMTDLPVGIGTLTLVLFAEGLRCISPVLARGSLLREWLAVSAAIFAMMALQYLLVLLAFVQPPYFLTLGRQWAITAAAWPVAVFLIRWGCGIRAAPADGREARNGA
ncbi:MAG: rod shape-determining protein MreD [Pseudomonadota bacterium]